MQIQIIARLFFLFALYCISDLAVKKHLLKNEIRRARRAKKI